MKEIANILDESMNVASAFKRDEINCISHLKILNQYNIYKTIKK